MKSLVFREQRDIIVRAERMQKEFKGYLGPVIYKMLLQEVKQKREELSDGMDRLSESSWHGPPFLGDRELTYDRHSKKCGECFGKNDKVLEGGANLWFWDIKGSAY